MTQDTVIAKRFNTSVEAEEWMISIVEAGGGDCIDNHRFAFVDDVPAMDRYWEQHDSGCCGGVDQRVYIRGREAIIGCNYGH